jgi:uncharacterized membrane protein (UPF0127 family)
MDQIVINGNAIDTLVAITYDEQEKGLMFQKNPKPMTFIYAAPSYNQFWMKNCFVPLDIVFALSNKVVDIRSGIPHSTALISNGGLSDLIVELPAGTCLAHDIKIGDVITPNFSDSTLKRFFMQANGHSF